MDMSLSELREMVMDREAWVLQFMGLQRIGHSWATELNWDHLTRQNVKKNLKQDTLQFLLILDSYKNENLNESHVLVLTDLNFI